MAAATARPIPVVNNVMTDEDLDNLRTDGKVRTIFMQGVIMLKKLRADLLFLQHSGKLVPVSVVKTHKLLTDKHSVSLNTISVLSPCNYTFIFCSFKLTFSCSINNVKFTTCCPSCE